MKFEAKATCQLTPEGVEAIQKLIGPTPNPGQILYVDGKPVMVVESFEEVETENGIEVVLHGYELEEVKP